MRMNKMITSLMLPTNTIRKRIENSKENLYFNAGVKELIDQSGQSPEA